MILDFANNNVLVVGDIILDTYWFGGTKRISPEAPVPIFLLDHAKGVENRLGGAANVAQNINSLMSNANLIGIIGDDVNGKIIESELSLRKIGFDLIKSSKPSIVKIRISTNKQQLLRIDTEEKYNLVDIQGIEKKVLDQVQKNSVIIFSDYAKGALTNIEKLIKIANQKNAKVIIDPKGDDYNKYKGAYLLTPNMQEFEAVSGKSNTDEELEAKAMQLIDKLDLEALLITRSEKGMSLFQKSKPAYHLKALAKEVFDVTGAGDTVIATLACALGSNTLEDSVYLSNLAASIVVGKRGACPVYFYELKLLLSQFDFRFKNFKDKNSLKLNIDYEKSKGHKIVFTNGCFDILHLGHIKYLNEAKRQGDKLVVAINSDESIRKLKGESRPVNNAKQRIEILNALECVDWVIEFDQDTPLDLIKTLNPDVLVKGGDYKINDIVGSEFVIKNGGSVKSLSFIEGYSTTSLIKKINSL